MDRHDPQDISIPTPSAADFAGSPFRLLTRVGDKLYRPARPAAATTAVPAAPHRPEDRAVSPTSGVWDWG